MCARLADRLNAARRATFVGRALEKEIFAQALSSPSPPWSVLYIHGAGGVGKSSLLRELASLCQTSGDANTNQTARALCLDARDFEPSPESFLCALSTLLETEETQSPLDQIADSSTRIVLFIDTYELLTPLDSWIRETFLPQLPDNALVVLAGREAPRPAWRLDSAWQELVRVLPLQNLSDSDSTTFLTQRQVPREQLQRVLDFTHGHPLALSLVADLFAQRTPSLAQTPFDISSSPDVVRLLVEHLVREVPSVRHRAALEACALVRGTTEALLAHLLELPRESDESAALFRWLQSLSFVEAGAYGLAPHDLAREAIVAHLRWRDAPIYADLHRRARSFYAAQLKTATPLQQQLILADYIFLHHDNSVLRPFLEWQENSEMSISRALPDDFPLLLAIVKRHEGDQSARIAAHWFARQADRVLVLREGARVAGFMMLLALHQTDESDRAQDETTRDAWNYLQQNAPLAKGEEATLFRFWMSHDSYQDVSSAQSLVFINVVRHYLTNAKLAFSFFVCANPDFWSPVFTYAGATRFGELNAQRKGQTFGVYGHDWRKMPPLQWLDMMGEREIAAAAAQSATALESGASAQSAKSGDSLNQGEYALAVRDALKNWSRPAALDHNALARSHRVLEVAGENASPQRCVEVLQKLLREACQNIGRGGRSELFYNALNLTYFEPSLTQEAAAEKMDVPFSTYRRYLKAGIERVTEELWRDEQAMASARAHTILGKE